MVVAATHADIIAEFIYEFLNAFVACAFQHDLYFVSATQFAVYIAVGFFHVLKVVAFTQAVIILAGGCIGKRNQRTFCVPIIAMTRNVQTDVGIEVVGY